MRPKKWVSGKAPKVKLCLQTVLLAVVLWAPVFGRNVYRARVQDRSTKEPVIGAIGIVDTLQIGANVDMAGVLILRNIPNGTYDIHVSCIGYHTKDITVHFPQENNKDTSTIYLEAETLQLQGIAVVTTNRSNRVPGKTPQRVEILGEEEVNEEISIRPGDISKLLSETSGIHVQQTSPLSGNVSFSLQGLPGVYTQLLKDGFPYFNGFSAGLSLLQIPPLDLRQVEIMQGSNSTLYGDGAVAGIVNLVSREPGATPEWNLILNGTSRNGADVSSYYRGRMGGSGVTFLASQSMQEAVDIDKDGFTDLPFVRQVTLNPKVYLKFGASTSLMVGVSTFFEDRSGGDITAMRFGVDSIHQYIERNESKRLNAQVRLDGRYKNHGKYTLKSSVYSFRRTLRALDNVFSGRQVSSYSELSYSSSLGDNDVVLGINVLSDSFSKKKISTNSTNYAYVTLGTFIQDDWHATDWLTLQPGARLDYHSQYNFQFMPHFSALAKLSKSLTLRSFAGEGYRIPVLESLLSDRDLLKDNVRLSTDVRTEKSGSVGADITYKYLHGILLVTLDQSFFYTRVNHSLMTEYFENGDSARTLTNANSRIVSKGFGTNALLALDELSLFINYTHSYVRKTLDGQTDRLALTPEDKLNITLSLEGEGIWRSGIEAFYTGRQYLEETNSFSPDYWIFGAMFERIFRGFSIVGNVENIFDERQTKHQRVIDPPFDNPTFEPLFEPLDGIVANIALRINLQ